MAGPLDWSLISGAVPAVVLGAGAAAGVVLVADRPGARAWWSRKLPLAVGAAVLLTFLTGLIVDKWWQPFPDTLPREVLAWIGVAFLGVALFVARLSGTAWKRRVLFGFGALLLVITAASEINKYFQQYPTLRAALGPWLSESTDFSKVGGKEQPADLVTAPPGKTIADVWRPPPGMPAKGTISEVKIPATASKFSARSAWVYLPPAYRATPRPQLPVLVLLAGQPGSPRDWIDAGGVGQILDDYAAAHRGLAPVVLLPDSTGSAFGNPMCLDSKLGNSQTYLTTDVKAWAAANLQVAPAGIGWSIGGYSYGGTCSVQLAVNAPDQYPTFLDMSGQREPTLGSRDQSVKEAFGGDAAAFARVNPVDVMAARRFPDTAGVFVAGSSDEEFTPQQRDMFKAAQQAGMAVQFVELPGGHSWQVWRTGLTRELPWIAERTGLARQQP